MSSDLYDVLEVRPSASSAEIRAAFRRLAWAHHPDRGAESTARMIAINRAYAVLGDPDRRRAYDARRASGRPPPPPPVAPEIPTEDPPWLIDLERGLDLEDWRQMYAEERQVWEHLVQARDPPDAALQDALERAKRDQLELENAIRARGGLEPLSVADLEARHARAERSRSAAAARVGCAALVLFVLGLRRAR